MTKYATKFAGSLLAVMAVLLCMAVLAPKANAVVDPLATPCTATVTDTTTVTDPNTSSVCKEKGNTGNPFVGPEGIITKVIQILVIILGIAAVIVIMVAGLSFVLSSGDPAKIATARNAIIYASVGLVVAVLAQTLVVFVLKKV